MVTSRVKNSTFFILNLAFLHKIKRGEYEEVSYIPNNNSFNTKTG